MKYRCREYPNLILQDIRNRRLDHMLMSCYGYCEYLNEEEEAIGVVRLAEKYGEKDKIYLYKKVDVYFNNGYFETDDKEVAEDLELFNELFHNGNLIERVEE